MLNHLENGCSQGGAFSDTNVAELTAGEGSLLLQKGSPMLRLAENNPDRGKKSGYISLGEAPNRSLKAVEKYLAFANPTRLATSFTLPLWAFNRGIA